MTNKHSILLVDDEPYILSSLVRVLEAEDRQIFTASSAEEASELLKDKGAVQIIISDNRLPQATGIDFLIKTKRLYPDTVRILMTGYPDLTSTMDAINRAHIWRYILKPIEMEELRVLVRQAVEYYNIMRENRLLLQIARQQSDFIKKLKDTYPQLSDSDFRNSGYSLDETRVSRMLEDFMKRYYPEKNPEE
jgi:DNA-binding NtrC family response regulator